MARRRGRLALSVLFIFGVMLLLGWFFAPADGPSGRMQAVQASGFKLKPVAASSYQDEFLPFIKKYCADCHGNGAQEGDFALDRYASIESVHRDRAVWTKLLKLVDIGSMPPSSAEQPSAEERKKAVDWLNHELFYVDCSAVQDPGRVTIRRLNKTEYNNTVNALLGIQFQPAENFPSDDVGHGFDNIGDVLSVPPLLVEKYLAAAEAVAQAAVRSRSPVYAEQRFAGDDLNTAVKTPDSVGPKAFGTNAKTTTKVKFPRTGKYVLVIPARQDRAGNENAKMVIEIAGKLLKEVSVASSKYEEFRIPFDAVGGSFDITVAFTNDFYDAKAEKHGDRNLHVRYLELQGPLDVTAEERKKQKLMKVIPGGKVTPIQAASRNMKDFLPRAFRRPVTNAELSRYVGLMEKVLKDEGSFEEAMQVGVQAVLMSPDFLFRVEGGRRQSGGVESLDDFALASRLSYFLWSSCPDDELFDLAQKNKLHEPEVLRAQTLRMLKDPRSNQLVSNFSSQWLGLRKLGTREIDPDPKLFPEFKPEIRQDLWRETEEFFRAIVRSDGSIFELLTGQYTFLNERLAKFYGVEGVTGPEFRRVDVSSGHRHGVLTQGSVLTLTSYPNRTSPVKRGEWVLSVLLGDAPPPPPPSVPGLDKTSSANPNLTFRESLELHRSDPGCASCHKTMDAIGFGLENFDAIGRWRTQEQKRDVDASGVLPGGEKFNGPDELMQILIGKKDQFARTLSEKLLTYAIGRGVDWYDRCAVESILQELNKDDRFSTLVIAIVESAPFQSRKVQPVEAVSASR